MDAHKNTLSLTGLSIRQPWVELILRGQKTIEVRTWKTKYRGELWLHAGKNVDLLACTNNQISSGGLVRGAFVGVAELKDCIEFDAITWKSLKPKHLNSVPFNKPYFGWILSDVRRVQPIPYRGTLGLMTISVTPTFEGSLYV